MTGIAHDSNGDSKPMSAPIPAFPHSHIERDARGVYTLRIDDAKSLNILASPVTLGLTQAVRWIAAQADARALVLRGSGDKAFVGGANIYEMAELDQMCIRDRVALWAVMGALIAGIVTILLFSFSHIKAHFAEGSKSAVSGALLASMNTAAEYGFGGVIAALPGFLMVASALKAIPDPLVGEAVAVTSLAGITGSASGGMSIALAAMAQTFIDRAQAAGIPMEVLHRIAAMASGGMDTLPHNGAVITLLAVTGLTHRQSYGDIFAITLISTLSVFLVIAFYYLTGIV